MLSAAGTRPGTGGDVSCQALSLLNAHRGQKSVAKVFPTPAPTRGPRGQPLRPPSPASAGLRTPTPRKRAVAGRAHLNGGCSNPPHHTHTAHGGLRAAPLLRGNPNRTHIPGSCLRPQSCRTKACLGYVTYWFSSLLAACGTKTDGLSRALRHRVQAESWPQPARGRENPTR